jgi:tetratricopeptide (TPR) repeat protein
LEAEHDNFRGLLQWALEQKETEVALHVAGLLGRFWRMHSYLSEGKKWLGGALAMSSKAPTVVRAKALKWLGVLKAMQGDTRHVAVLAEESLAIYQQLDDMLGQAEALEWLGCIKAESDYGEATTLLEKALALFRELDYTDGVASSLGNLGSVLAEQGNYQWASYMRKVLPFTEH